MSIALTSYVPSDQKGVKKVIFDGFKTFGFKYNPRYDSDLDGPSIYIKNGGMFYVLKKGGKVIGTVAVINKAKVGELKRLYVEKSYQGKGYGSLLGMPHAKKLDANLYELRVRGKEEIRIIYGFKGKTIYLLRGFKKQKQKTPRKEIDTARQRYLSLT